MSVTGELGTVTMWNATRGFGFLKPDSGDRREHFIHATATTLDALKAGDKVTYNSDPDAPRGPRAVNVRIAE